MLVFQAFTLSLLILLRYLLVIPVLLIGLFLYGLFGGLVGFLIGMIVPGLYFVILFAVSASSSIIPAMLGARFGFASKLIKPDNGLKKLFTPAIMYGVTEALALGALLLPTMGLMAFTAPPSVSDLAGAPSLDPTSILSSLDSATSLSMSSLFLAVFIGACAIRACLLVPIASASIGRDPNGRAYTPFKHFAAGFWPLLALVLLSYIGLVVLFVLVSLAIPLLGAGAMISDGATGIEQLTQGEAPKHSIWPAVALIAVYTILGFWSLSLQCAGGVLVYLRLRETSPTLTETLMADLKGAEGNNAQSSPRMSADDLRALRKSRGSGGQ